MSNYPDGMTQRDHDLAMGMNPDGSWPEEADPVTVDPVRANSLIADCLEGKRADAFGMHAGDWTEFLLDDLSHEQRVTLALFILEPGRLPSLMHDLRRTSQRNSAGRANELLAELSREETEGLL